MRDLESSAIGNLENDVAYHLPLGVHRQLGLP